MKFLKATLTLGLLASLAINTAMAKTADHPHSLHHQHPTFTDMSAGIPCVYSCLESFRDKYDYEAKTQRQICYTENYDASSLLEGKLTDCVIDRCSPETIEEFQPSEFCVHILLLR